ncbi:MAG: hypothetical protein H6613_02015 [Ignavibacteriales bacterium]|nr:hypothetical protein [Ignavibacteriales bacterium]
MTNTLIGDPIISLAIPDKPNFVIEERGLELNSNALNDLDEIAEIKIKYYNYGIVYNDSIQILIEHEFNNITSITSIKMLIPNFEDSLKIEVPIKSQAGNHSVKIKLDAQNKFNEISENDNTLNFTFNVGSSLIRPILDYQFVNGIKDKLTLLNPTSRPNEEIIIIDISNSPHIFDTKK